MDIAAIYKKQIEKEIREKVSKGEDFIEKLKDEIAELADKGGVTAYWGEYGTSGETYYPKGTDVEAHYIGWQASQYADDNGILTEGLWISSSEMC